MLSLKKGFLFIGAAFREAIKSPQMLKPTWIFLLGGLILSLIVFVPIGLVLVLIGTGFWGMALLGVFCAGLFFSLFVWGEITALMTACFFADSLGGEKLDLNGASELMRSAWKDVLQFELAFPALMLSNWFRGRPKKTVTLPLPKKAKRPVIQDNWQDALYLMLPLLSLEKLKLKAAVERIQTLVGKNLLRFSPGLIKVQLIGAIILLIFVASGTFLGILVGTELSGSPFVSMFQRLSAAGLGLLTASITASIGIAINAFVRVIYHTAIYRWMINVTEARRRRKPELAEAPPILSGVLNK